MSTQPFSLAGPDASAGHRILPIQPAVRRGPARTWRSLAGRMLLRMPTGAWMAFDLLIVLAGITIGQNAFVWWHPDTGPLIDYRLWIVCVALGLSVVLAGLMFGLYERNTLWHRGRIVLRAALTIGFAMVATFVIVQVFLYSEFSRRAAAFAVVFYLPAATGLRLFANRALRSVQRGLLIVGHGPTTSLLLRAVQHGRLPSYRLHGIVSEDPHRHGRDIRGAPILGGLQHLERILAECDVHEVVVADHGPHQAECQQAALACLRHGCRVTNETTFYETAFGEAPVAHVTPGWFFSADLRGQCEEHAALKRVFDVCVASIGLSLAWPLCLITALLVKLQDGGPVLYAQERVGQGGRLFTLYKFRTMRTDAEAAGCVWAADGDPRVTRIGRFLRRTRLDELPQLWNVLRGDMSMVGPRPERPDFVEPLSRLIPYYRERHLIKPGLTGWAQINYRYGASVSDARRKLQFDLFYIKHMSLELDLIILLRTVGTLLSGSR